jgi:mono/diheme cytochrome c family protein
MPTWGQEFGGPLRPDQIDALVAFIMNWEERALAEAEAPPLEAPSAEMVGTDITIALPEGDPERGKALSEGPLGCSGCHVLATVGPPWSASGDLPPLEERAAQRIAAEDYSGEAADAQQYLIESILKPDAYVVAGYPPGVMPRTYGERMTAQDLADVLAYMLSFR